MQFRNILPAFSVLLALASTHVAALPVDSVELTQPHVARAAVELLPNGNALERRTAHLEARGQTIEQRQAVTVPPNPAQPLLDAVTVLVAAITRAIGGQAPAVAGATGALLQQILATATALVAAARALGTNLNPTAAEAQINQLTLVATQLTQQLAALEAIPNVAELPLADIIGAVQNVLNLVPTLLGTVTALLDGVLPNVLGFLLSLVGGILGGGLGGAVPPVAPPAV